MTHKIKMIVLLLCCFSCSQTKDKTEFIGIWESVEKHHDKTVLTFYQDSLILDAYSGDFHTHSDWTFDKSQIYLKNVRIIDSIIHDSLTYKYDFNSSKDTLTIKLLSNDPMDYSKYIKVQRNPFSN